LSLRVVEQAGLTDVGRQRQTNEDNYLDSAPIFAVADGMGGARAGEVASQIAVEAFDIERQGDASLEQQLIDTAKAANQRIHELASGDETRAGMGTTLTAIMVGPDEIAIGHVGDSRAYLLRDGHLERLTHDHSLVEEFVRQGKLTPEEAESHPHRSIITRALGPEPEVEVETYTVAGRANDTFLLCSDGLTTMVTEDEVLEYLASSASLQEAAEDLIDLANEKGGKDNITVVLLRLEESVGEDPETDTFVEEAPTATAPSDTQIAAPPSAEPQVPSTRRAHRSRGYRTYGKSRPRRGKQKRRRGRLALLAAAACIAIAAGAVFAATREYYFLGTNDQGFVALYRGLPYDLPLGLRLYEPQYASPVAPSSIGQPERNQVLNNQLRTQSDATALLRRLELEAAAR
jgi:PPM family protein phosphatase